MQVILISQPSIEILGPLLKKVTNEAYSNDTTPEGFLGILAALSDRNISDPSLLKHLYYSFLCVAAIDTVQESLERAGLHHVVFDTSRRGFTGVILSGTAAAFKEAIFECCDSTSNTDIRELYNQIYLALQSAGLRRVWNDTTRRKVKDGTFLITRK